MRLVVPLMVVAWAVVWPVLLRPAAEAGGDAVLPPVDPKGPLRIMDQDGSRTTSDCVGYPVTPLCAAETKLACAVRNNRQLCRIAVGEEPPPPAAFKPVDGQTYIRKYRVIGARRLTAEQIPPGRHAGSTAWRPGDVAITFERWHCPHGRCRKALKDNMSYILRPDGDRWKVVTWNNYWDFSDWPPPGAGWDRK